MDAQARNRVVGIDFDNTIAGYDELLHEVAVERGLISAEVACNKKAIRDTIRALPEGELGWRALQSIIYGARMGEARLLDGVREFIAECRHMGIRVYVVSHKTEYANFGE